MPSWNSNRIFNRPSNGREISSSVFGLTRRTRLYLFSKQNVKVNCDDDDGDDDDDHGDYDNGGGEKLTDLFGTHMVNSQ